jgi:hypothetical protein
MFRSVAVTAVGLALTVLANVAQAETTELTDAQMDQITAGAFSVVFGTSNLQDCGGTMACSAFPQSTYTFRPDTRDFIDLNSGVVWAPVGSVYWFGGVAFGVLRDPTGRIWDGGLTVTTGPISGTPTQILPFPGPATLI